MGLIGPPRSSRSFSVRSSFASSVNVHASVRLYYLELCDLSAVEAFCAMLVETLPKLDILINNAAQTLTRPAGWTDRSVPNPAGGGGTSTSTSTSRSSRGGGGGSCSSMLIWGVRG